MVHKNRRSKTRSNSNMQSKHKSYIRRFLNSAERGSVNYKDLAVRVNRKFGTNYTVYQIAGYIGRQIQLRYSVHVMVLGK